MHDFKLLNLEKIQPKIKSYEPQEMEARTRAKTNLKCTAPSSKIQGNENSLDPNYIIWGEVSVSAGLDMLQIVVP